jgi:putative ABC transport system ATP-binding protein
MLKLNAITKTFKGPEGEVHALPATSLEVNQGEFIAVRGASGAGKTTLLLLAAGLLRPDSGTVLFKEQDLYGLSAGSRAGLRSKHFGFVFQQYHLVPYLDIAENIMLPSMALRTDNAAERARELITRLGLESRASHKPEELSAGEKQRTAFARAVFLKPDLLLVDEPTGNLDRANADVLLVFLKEYCKSGGAVLMATHDDHAAEQADRLIEIPSGGKE